MVRNLEKRDALQVAGLHIQGISKGFISSLGQLFVASLYEAIAEDKNSFGFVEVEGDKVLGFVVFSRNLSGLYKSILFKKGFKFGLIIAKQIFSFRVLKKIFDNIFYPSKMKTLNLPDAELLSIAVSQQGQGKGIAKKLIKFGFRECAKRNIGQIKVLVAANNEPANNLYQKCGFELKTQIDNHNILSNIYVKDLKKA